MEEEELPISWKVVFVIIATVLVASLIILFVIFYCIYMPEKNVTDILKTPRAVLGTVGNQSSSPTPRSTPTPTTEVTPSTKPSDAPHHSPLPNPYPSPTPTPPTLLLPLSESFENGMSNWSVSGDVTLINQSINPVTFARPYHGNYMIRIGREVNEGFPLSENRLSIKIPTSVKKITFRYNLFTYDYKGFDEPAFLVTLGNQIIFQKSAAELDRDDPQTRTEYLDTTGWQEEVIEVPPSSTEQIQLLFQAGNDETNLPSSQPHQSWVYLDSIKIE